MQHVPPVACETIGVCLLTCRGATLSAPLRKRTFLEGFKKPPSRRGQPNREVMCSEPCCEPAMLASRPELRVRLREAALT